MTKPTVIVDSAVLIPHQQVITIVAEFAAD